MTAPGAVWVYAERHGESFRPVSLEVLGSARSVADSLGTRLVAITIGDGEGPARELSNYAADEVIGVDHPMLDRYDTKLFTDLLEAELRPADPSVLLLGATRDGQDLAGRLAVRLRTGLTAHVTSLEVDAEKRLVGWVPGFGGGIEAGVVCPQRRPAIVTIRPGVFPAPSPGRASGTVRFVHPTVDESSFGSRRVTFEPKGTVVDLTRSEVLVVGGRGTDGDFTRLQRLAHAIGAEIGATRVATDSGWVERERMIGQTGVVTRPKVAVILGASGAVQFTVGIEKAGFVIAVNRDPDAPIFEAADLGIVGDLGPIVDKLVDALGEA
ncbi:MAG TPA: electron transfer flavoprotein subunit alpha/FixB family protein [Thermoplasmata archaeon]|nr:electron transfer flavoprotein subunit alpha/FixB family protein [Thermoplasmata archaeon]